MPATRHPEPRMPTTTIRAFAVPPPPGHAWLTLLVLALLPLLILLPLGAVPAVLGSPAVMLGLALPLLLVGLLGLTMRRREVRVGEGRIEVRASFYRKRLAVGELDLGGARIVDLGEDTELRPVLKTNGFSLPGFHAGHFRIRRGLEKAFCLISGTGRVLWIPVRDGSHLLLGVERPQELLARLREEA